MARSTDVTALMASSHLDTIPYLMTDIIGEFEEARDEAFKGLYECPELLRTPLRDRMLRLIYRSWVMRRPLTVGDIVLEVQAYGGRGRIMAQLKEMEKHGVIHRTRVEGDKRATYVSATPKLIEFYRDLMPKLLRNCEDAIAKIKRDATVTGLKSALSSKK